MLLRLNKITLLYNVHVCWRAVGWLCIMIFFQTLFGKEADRLEQATSNEATCEFLNYVYSYKNMYDWWKLLNGAWKEWGGWMNGWMTGWMNKWIDGLIVGTNGWIWMFGKIDEVMDG